MQSNEARIEYLDALRTVACFAVVMLHVTALNTYNVEFQSPEWNIFMFYESIVNWAVPVFVMISGAAMLSREYSYKRIQTKVLRLVCLFFLWSALYLLFDIAVYGVSSYAENSLWLQVLLQGHYHMWYLIMLAGLYLVIPILKAIIYKPQIQKAFIFLSIMLTFFVPSVLDLLQESKARELLRYPVFGAICRAFINVHNDLHYHLSIGFTAYSVIGYVLVHRFDKQAYHGLPIGCFCALGGAAITFLEIMIANSKEAAGSFMQYYQVGILLQSVGVVLIMKMLTGKAIIHYLARMSPLCLGIYFVHPMIIETLQKIGISSVSFNPVIFIPFFSLVVFFAAAIISYMLIKTPLKMMIAISGGKNKWERTKNKD